MSNFSDVPKISDLEGIVERLIGIIPAFAGITLLVMLIVGGFLFITSEGNPQNIERAKKNITAAILGIILIVFSVLILRLIENFTGVNLTKFRIRID